MKMCGQLNLDLIKHITTHVKVPYLNETVLTCKASEAHFEDFANNLIIKIWVL